MENVCYPVKYNAGGVEELSMAFSVAFAWSTYMYAQEATAEGYFLKETDACKKMIGEQTGYELYFSESKL